MGKGSGEYLDEELEDAGECEECGNFIEECVCDLDDEDEDDYQDTED